MSVPNVASCGLATGTSRTDSALSVQLRVTFASAQPREDVCAVARSSLPEALQLVSAKTHVRGPQRSVSCPHRPASMLAVTSTAPVPRPL